MMLLLLGGGGGGGGGGALPSKGPSGFGGGEPSGVVDSVCEEGSQPRLDKSLFTLCV